MPEEEAQAPEAIEVGGADKTKSMILLLIVLAVLVMVLTPVIAVIAVKQIIPKPPDEVTNTKTAVKIKIPKLTSNIEGNEGTRLIQADIEIELNKKSLRAYFQEYSAETNPKGMLGKIKAEILSILRNNNLNTLLSPGADKVLAERIKTRLNDLLKENKIEGEGQVVEVYFPRFLIQ